MLYTVYVDSLTKNHFVKVGESLHSVNARATNETRSVHGSEGVTYTLCEVIDWRWLCNRNGYGKYRMEDEDRAAIVLEVK